METKCYQCGNSTYFQDRNQPITAIVVFITRISQLGLTAISEVLFFNSLLSIYFLFIIIISFPPAGYLVRLFFTSCRDRSNNDNDKNALWVGRFWVILWRSQRCRTFVNKQLFGRNGARYLKSLF